MRREEDTYFGMPRSTIISFALHAAIILAAILTLPNTTLQSASDDDEVSVDFSPLPAQQSDAKGHHAAPHELAIAHIAPKAPTPKVNKPIVAPPPPPPPPPPTPKAAELPKPPQPAPPPPPPQPSLSAAIAPPPPPKTQPKSTSTAQQPPLPMPPPPMPPAPDQSVTHQIHVVKTPVPLSKSVLNTLQFLHTLQKQDKAPTSVYNPDAGGAPDAGGSATSTSNTGLTMADKNAIASHVRPCWDIDGEAPNVGQMSVELQVETDGTGTVHNAVVAPADQDKLTDPIFNAFAQRAIDAVMNVQCATLPLPQSMLGQNQTFAFHFSP
jgi:hypothetical protein